MLYILCLLAIGTTLPGEKVEIITSPLATAPKLVPGYPERKLYSAVYEGRTYQVWGWLESQLHWIQSENPHVPYVKPAVIRNFGVTLKHDVQASHAGTLQTNDQEFAKKFFDVKHVAHPGKPCPGPGPCPEPRPGPKPGPTPSPPAPDSQRFVIAGAIVALALAVVVGALLIRSRR